MDPGSPGPVWTLKTIPPQLSLQPKSVSDECLLANKDSFAFLGQVDITNANSATSYVDFEVKYAGARAFRTDCRVDMKRGACADQQTSLCYCQSFQDNVYTFVYNGTATTPFSRADVRLTWRDNSPTPFFTSSKQLPLIRDKCQILELTYLSQATNQQCLITGADSLLYRGTLDATDYTVDATSQTLQFKMKYYDSDVYQTLCQVNVLSDGCPAPSTQPCYCESLVDNVYTVVYQQQATPTGSKAQVRLAWTDSLGRNKVSDVIVNPPIKDISCDVINMYIVTVAEEVITIDGTVDVTGRATNLWPRIINFELKQENSSIFETFCTVDIGQDGCQTTSPAQCFCEKFQADVYTVRYQSAASAKFSNGQVRLAWSDTSYNSVYSASQTFSDVKEIIAPAMTITPNFDTSECIVAGRDVFTYTGSMDVKNTNTPSQTVIFKVKSAGSDYFSPVCSIDMTSITCNDQPNVMCHCQSYVNNVYSFVFTGVVSLAYNEGEVRLAWQGVSSAFHYSPSSQFPEIKELKCHDLSLKYQDPPDDGCIVADMNFFTLVGTLDISGSSIDVTTQTVNFQFKLAGAEDFQTMCSVELITDQCPPDTDRACYCSGFDKNVYSMVYTGMTTVDLSKAEVRLRWQNHTDTKYSSNVTFPVVKVGHCNTLEIINLYMYINNQFFIDATVDATNKDEITWPRVIDFEIRASGSDHFTKRCTVNITNSGCYPAFDYVIAACYCESFFDDVYLLHYDDYPLPTDSGAPVRLVWRNSSSYAIYSSEALLPEFQTSGCGGLHSLTTIIVLAIAVVLNS
ncbi:uncharacterized protein LOC131956019 [Physella acuta]|uniref:uncharacterized protein LOC131956019 n=1 Tax=Physella acuta TaxID=109671 RepID=UPI0027DE7746|nr:uncharacterized protein LOC131956019 [Physella acuta]